MDDRQQRGRGRRDKALEERIGRRLRAARMRHRLTQAELAHILGTRLQTVSLSESAKIHLNISYLYRAARALGVTVEEFYGEDAPAATLQWPMNHPETQELVSAYYVAPPEQQRHFRDFLLAVTAGL